LHAFPDLFCAFADRALAVEHEIRANWRLWEADPSWQSLKATFTGDVISGRPTHGAIMRVNNIGHPARALYAALRGIDEAFAHVVPGIIAKPVGRVPPALKALEAYVARTGRLDSGTQPKGGALLPRLTGPHGDEVQDARDLLTAVRHVPEETWGRCHLVLDARPGAIGARDLRAGLQVACVPVIADPAELSIEARTSSGGRRVYRIAPRDMDITLDRIDDIVVALDAADVAIGVAPEATLSPALLERWQQALRARRSRTLRYVIAGSGDFSAASDPTENVAVLLDGQTGKEIGRQNKLFAFDMSDAVVDKWGLTPYLGAGAAAEDLAPVQRRLTVFDFGAIRLAIVVCEDLNQPVELGPLIRDMGLTHVVAPVFSRPIKPHRWEHAAASIHAHAAGAAVIVVNSLAMASILKTADPGTAIVVPPVGDAVVGHAKDAADLVRLLLDVNGTAHLI
jgi:predicted amidohydrolase